MIIEVKDLVSAADSQTEIKEKAIELAEEANIYCTCPGGEDALRDGECSDVTCDSQVPTGEELNSFKSQAELDLEEQIPVLEAIIEEKNAESQELE